MVSDVLLGLEWVCWGLFLPEAPIFVAFSKIAIVYLCQRKTDATYHTVSAIRNILVEHNTPAWTHFTTIINQYIRRRVFRVLGWWKAILSIVRKQQAIHIFSAAVTVEIVNANKERPKNRIYDERDRNGNIHINAIMIFNLCVSHRHKCAHIYIQKWIRDCIASIHNTHITATRWSWYCVRNIITIAATTFST